MASVLYQSGALRALMKVRGAAKVPMVSIYTFHHIAESDAGYEFDPGVADATPAQFRRQLEILQRCANPISLNDLYGAMDGNELPANPVMITFDDGYASNYTTALPILTSLGVPATFFVATKFIDERRLFWWESVAWILKHRQRDLLHLPRSNDHEQLAFDCSSANVQRDVTNIIKNTHGLSVDDFVADLARAAEVEWSMEIETRLANQVLLTWDQLRTMSQQGMAVGSHTHSHRVLQTVPVAELKSELAGSKALLENKLGTEVQAIAYPVGRSIKSDADIRDALVAAGYRLGFTNASGVNVVAPASLRHRLPVADPFDVRRLATDRDMSDAMFVAQMAVPQFAYVQASAH
jgi:peptidoglycan/xylan/chitin deacetylase (PgdA/CDA1 family)